MTDHVQLAYEEIGEEQARSLVLLHGFCGSRAYWSALHKPLGAQYRVIIPDLRGHGQSGAPDAPYTIDAMADDVAALIRQLGLEKPIVLGHSLGGYITLALSEQNPQLLSGFGLIHSTAFPDTEPGKANRDKAIATIREQGIRPFVDGLIPKLFAPAHLASMADRVQAAVEIGYGTPPLGAIHTTEAMRDRVDRNHVLREASVPVLLVAGAQDQIIPVEKTFSVQGDHITQTRLETAGHMSLMESPDELSAILLSFGQRVHG